MHQSLSEQYFCECENCKQLNLANGGSGLSFNKVLKTAETAFKKLFNNGAYKPEDLAKTKEYKDLVDATAQSLSTAIPHEVPSELKNYLEKDVFIFSGLKTHAQLSEARSYLKNEKGEIENYSSFEQKILKLNPTYNQLYLEAEYLFAVQSAQSASNWANLQEDTNRYCLEYRTAGDDRVRDNHQKLAGICLPKDDAFWTEYYPPNGWRCRCVATEVLAKDYNKSDSNEAIKKGETATTQISKTDKNKLEMFRFNPGIEKKIFPPKNTYEPKYCEGAKLNLSKLIGHSKFVLSSENERCKAKKVVEGMASKKWNTNEILKLPREKQFKTIFESKNGGSLSEHLLVKKIDDYNELVSIGKEFAKQGKIVEIMPEISEKEKTIRKLIFPNLKSKTSNPDLKIDGQYFDLKRPRAIKNVTGNANKASKQGAFAIISNSQIGEKLNYESAKKRADAILSDNNKLFYTNSEIFFFLENKIHKFP